MYWFFKHMKHKLLLWTHVYENFSGPSGCCAQGGRNTQRPECAGYYHEMIYKFQILSLIFFG